MNFNVQTLGTKFLRGVNGNGTITLSNGLDVTVQWEETTQGFTIIGYDDAPSGGTHTGDTTITYTGNLSEFQFLIDAYEWHGEISSELADPSPFDMYFYEYGTANNGAVVVEGETERDGLLYDFVIGNTAHLLPHLPSYHSRHYAWLEWFIYSADDGAIVTVCAAVLFNAEDITRGQRSDITVTNAGLVVSFVTQEATLVPEAYDCTLVPEQYWTSPSPASIHMSPY